MWARWVAAEGYRLAVVLRPVLDIVAAASRVVGPVALVAVVGQARQFGLADMLAQADIAAGLEIVGFRSYLISF